MLQQPDRILDGWRGWHAGLQTRPAIIATLHGGRSNRSFLLESGGERMVLRINGEGALLPGSNRDSEFATWQAASKQGIAPPLLHVDAQSRFLVSAYVQDNLPGNATRDERVIKQALGLLERCHRLDVKTASVDYSSYIEKYWNAIEEKDRPIDPGLLEQREPMRFLLEDIINSDADWGLCHHDPVIENFVGSPGRLYLIDWEYAAYGLLIMDYAALAVEWDMDNATLGRLANVPPGLLEEARNLYRYLCALWEEVTSYLPQKGFSSWKISSTAGPKSRATLIVALP